MLNIFNTITERKAMYLKTELNAELSSGLRKTLLCTVQFRCQF